MSQYIYDSKTKNITPVAGLFNNPIGYPVMTGATNTEDGKAGLVPQPKIEDMNKALFGDGTYKDIENNNDSISNRWNNAKEYSVGDYCIHNNILWNCLTAHTNQTPIMDSTYWKQCNITEEMHKLNAGITFNSNEIGRLNENITINNEDIEVLNREVSTLVSQMKETVSDAWNKTVTYGINAYCIHKNALWKCLLQHTNQEPVNGSIYWEKCTVATELSKLNSDITQCPTKIHKDYSVENQSFKYKVNELSLIFITYGTEQSADFYVCRCRHASAYAIAPIYKTGDSDDIYDINLDIESKTITITSKRSWIQVDVISL